VGQKTALNYFTNNFVKPRSIFISLAHEYFSKFPIICVFHIFYKLENREAVQDSFSSLVSRQKRIYRWFICHGFKSV